MRVLVLVPRFLWPLISGAEIRNFNLLRETSRHHDVYLLSFLHSPDERKHFPELEALCKKVIGVELSRSLWHRPLYALRSLFSNRPFILDEYLDVTMTAVLQQTINEHKIDVVHAHCPHMAQYAGLGNRAAFVYDTHNIYYVLWDRFASVQRNPLTRAFAFRQRDLFRRWERDIGSRVQKIFALSESDRAQYLDIAPDADIVTIPNGADVDFFQPREQPPEPDSIIYFANFGWPPQSDAAVYFVKDILPRVLEKRPNAKLYLVGKTPPNRVVELACANVIVTGFVDDIRDAIARASVVVMPLRVGSGTKHRVFQALSMKKALVTTSTGAEGIDLIHGETAMIADDIDSFADSVLRVLSEPDLREALGRRGRELILERYNWKHIYTGLDHAFREAVAKKAAS